MGRIRPSGTSLGAIAVTWANTEDLVRNLGLAASPADPDAVAKALKQELATVHPDTTGGEFASAPQRERFLRLQDGLRFLHSQRSGPPALREADVPSIVEETVRALQNVPRAQPKTRASVLEASRQQIQRASRAPKVTSATLFAGSSAVFTFIGSLSGHPLFKDWAIHAGLLWPLGGLWVMSGVAFVAVWWRERTQEREVLRALSEDALQSAFRYACWHAERSQERRFSRNDVIESLVSAHRSLNPFQLRRLGQKVSLSSWSKWIREMLMPEPGIGEDEAAEIAAFYIENWLERGAVTRSAFRDVVDWFEIDPAVLERQR